jgi:hypothetical protein
MSAYIKTLASTVAADASPPPSPSPDLQTRLATWFNALPEFTRQRPFHISEIEVPLAKPGRLISPALLALGWTRKRRWGSKTSYRRYWLPPGMNPRQEVTK